MPLAWACASAPAPLLDPALDAPGDATTLQVSLVFGPDADLDLYVTGPSEETVYYANTPARDRGHLDADRRCDAPPPRVETITFPAAVAGRYRVGIDYPEDCGEITREVPYRLVWHAPGAGPRQRDGVARFGRFDSRVVEIDVGDTGP